MVSMNLHRQASRHKWFNTQLQLNHLVTVKQTLSPICEFYITIGAQWQLQLSSQMRSIDKSAKSSSKTSRISSMSASSAKNPDINPYLRFKCPRVVTLTVMNSFICRSRLRVQRQRSDSTSTELHNLWLSGTTIRTIARKWANWDRVWRRRKPSWWMILSRHWFVAKTFRILGVRVNHSKKSPSWWKSPPRTSKWRCAAGNTCTGSLEFWSPSDSLFSFTLSWDEGIKNEKKENLMTVPIFILLLRCW